MQRDRPSRTAWSAAGYRAAHQLLDGAAVFDDPLALQILGPAGVSDALRVAEKHPERGPLRWFIAMRHRFGEDVLAAAVADGVRQVVLLGAGLDTTAYRPSARVAGLRAYEVDHPATQAWKRELVAAARLVPACELVHVSVDFERQALRDRLRDNGFDVSVPAVFLWLGVVPYLTPEAVSATLAVMGAVPGAEVVADYPEPPDARTPSQARAAEAFRARVARIGEPVRSAYTGPQMARLLDAAGMAVVEDLTAAQFVPRYTGRAAGSAGGGAHLLHARSVVRG